jgi:hypothetical protein
MVAVEYFDGEYYIVWKSDGEREIEILRESLDSHYVFNYCPLCGEKLIES